MQNIAKLRQELLSRIDTLDEPRSILKAPELRELQAHIKEQPSEERAAFGKAVNDLRGELEERAIERENERAAANVEAIDVSAPWDINVAPENRPRLLSAEFGSVHPLSLELERVIDIFTRMGFSAIESRQLDDDFHMFGALNFPEGHPARDGYDTFRTHGGLIAPAHTSTMQYRILRSGHEQLNNGGYIASISYGRVFRNEDVDATHEHTFYQVEGIYVSDSATLGEMLGTLRSFFETYYSQKLKIKTQPAYFPFVEPGLEFLIERPAALGGRDGEFLEMLGCGMIHPNVLREAGIDPNKYRGFAWGGGIERLVMLKYGIEDLRYFESARLAFLRKFA